MKTREFNKLCRIHFGKKKKGEDDLIDEQKHGMLLYLVRNRSPIHVSLITDLLDWAWVESCAYFHQGKNFLYTTEQKMMLANRIKEW